MAFEINTTTVIDGFRNLLNIANQTTFVGSGLAATGAGAVGSYALVWATGTPLTAGSTYTGSNLSSAGMWSGTAVLPSPGAQRAWDWYRGTTTMSGTWRALNTNFNSNTQNHFGIAIRIS